MTAGLSPLMRRKRAAQEWVPTLPSLHQPNRLSSLTVNELGMNLPDSSTTCVEQYCLILALLSEIISFLSSPATYISHFDGNIRCLDCSKITFFLPQRSN